MFLAIPGAALANDKWEITWNDSHYSMMYNSGKTYYIHDGNITSVIATVTQSDGFTVMNNIIVNPNNYTFRITQEVLFYMSDSNHYMMGNYNPAWQYPKLNSMMEETIKEIIKNTKK
jgi:hypothetical protein